MVACRQNGLALWYVPRKQRSPELCMKACEQDGLALRYVPRKPLCTSHKVTCQLTT